MTVKRASLTGRDILFDTTSRQPPPAPPPARSGGKYTILLDGPTTVALLGDEAELTRRLGFTPKRSDIIRALLALLHDNTALMDQLTAELRAGKD